MGVDVYKVVGADAVAVVAVAAADGVVAYATDAILYSPVVAVVVAAAAAESSTLYETLCLFVVARATKEERQTAVCAVSRSSLEMRQCAPSAHYGHTAQLPVSAADRRRV